jgi:gliding motility-associated-like protein
MENGVLIIWSLIILQKKRFFNQMTPNGDGYNDIVVENLDKFPNNSIKIYNRWGVLVFDTRGYNSKTNYFNGESNGRITLK